MPAFAGIDHVSLSVTDLDRSEQFYTEVLGLKPLLDFGSVRILVDRPSGFILALAKHDGAAGGPFTELNTGLDHLGMAAATRDELVEWERRFEALGVTYTPIRDEAFASHLNFRDPDDIALEFSASNEVYSGWLAELQDRDIPADEIRARVMDHLQSRG
ncbi:VOC family protein [Kribbella sp. HUAS MG21]|jgi:catechol 2,3-dioxygenase-like lactoylglutathione lyase family enzyme|uniref:VOC family protein n=1 Tax=Kribbella sp. HUAS MG21 TaxID=3160966 RepID=A0AAU7T4J5_9ACTN